MPDDTGLNDQLTNPQDVRGVDGTRADGRPTRPDQPLEPRSRDSDAPTVAPEEQGEHPTTEHAPGGDL